MAKKPGRTESRLDNLEVRNNEELVFASGPEDRDTATECLQRRQEAQEAQEALHTVGARAVACVSPIGHPNPASSGWGGQCPLSAS